ncbi:uncharacterized protein EV420DRAFT_1209044 [Desarmillaria tabescens]|uniref:Uncharacterized protein n=1 Tax=Armillaria tabescens TaxID=1929756 RepID=A0AA39JB44_ARMTA|nr:uncharacterized protein EV420DRAFT_1209044 [Desarmillaria tabescens]KAK0438521.1 hypothetical protein EV420DRAFT_1209044 [Desarmillaria tabescens]
MKEQDLWSVYNGLAVHRSIFGLWHSQLSTTPRTCIGTAKRIREGMCFGVKSAMHVCGFGVLSIFPRRNAWSSWTSHPSHREPPHVRRRPRHRRRGGSAKHHPLLRRIHHPPTLPHWRYSQPTLHCRPLVQDHPREPRLWHPSHPHQQKRRGIRHDPHEDCHKPFWTSQLLY